MRPLPVRACGAWSSRARRRREGRATSGCVESSTPCVSSRRSEATGATSSSCRPTDREQPLEARVGRSVSSSWLRVACERVGARLHEERHLIDVAPAPLFSRLGRAGHGMVLFACMAARVLVGRGVTTADATARHAHPKVKPGASDAKALLAAGDCVGQAKNRDSIEMSAHSHRRRPWRQITPDRMFVGPNRPAIGERSRSSARAATRWSRRSPRGLGGVP